MAQLVRFRLDDAAVAELGRRCARGCAAGIAVAADGPR